MRIGILSDTHDHLKRTARALDRLRDEGVEALIHCGDLTGTEVVHACGALGLPSYYVYGNNDFDEIPLRLAMEATGGICLGRGGEIVLTDRRIAVTHGDLAREARRLVEAAPDYFLFGHTHVPLDRREGPTRWINPGALHRAESWTVAVLDPEADDLRFLEID